MKLCRKRGRREGKKEEGREGERESGGGAGKGKEGGRKEKKKLAQHPTSVIIRSQINCRPACPSPNGSTLSQEFLPNPQDEREFEKLAISF